MPRQQALKELIQVAAAGAKQAPRARERLLARSSTSVQFFDVRQERGEGLVAEPRPAGAGPVGGRAGDARRRWEGLRRGRRSPTRPVGGWSRTPAVAPHVFVGIASKQLSQRNGEPPGPTCTHGRTPARRRAASRLPPPRHRRPGRRARPAAPQTRRRAAAGAGGRTLVGCRVCGRLRVGWWAGLTGRLSAANMWFLQAQTGQRGQVLNHVTNAPWGIMRSCPMPRPAVPT